MICPACQFNNSDSTKFCGNCGKALGAAEQPQQPAPQIQTVTSTTAPVSYPQSSLENLFKNSWQLYKKDWITLLIISFITVAVWKVWGLIIAALGLTFGLGAISTGNASTGAGIALLGVAGSILAWIVAFEIAFWGSAAAVISLILSQNNQVHNFETVYTQAKKYLWPLSVVSLLVSLISIAGFVVLLIPGFVLLFLMQFANFVVLAENLTGWQAVKRSIKLIWHNFFHVLARNIISGAAVLLIGVLFGRVLFFSLISQVVILPFVLTWSYLVYKETVEKSN